MMTVVYRVLAKLIAERMAPVLAKVISPHQHGFIKGRSIYDNILAAMIGIEYAKFKKQECILLQLDLNKYELHGLLCKIPFRTWDSVLKFVKLSKR